MSSLLWLLSKEVFRDRSGNQLLEVLIVGGLCGSLKRSWSSLFRALGKWGKK